MPLIAGDVPPTAPLISAGQSQTHRKSAKCQSKQVWRIKGEKPTVWLVTAEKSLHFWCLRAVEFMLAPVSLRCTSSQTASILIQLLCFLWTLQCEQVYPFCIISLSNIYSLEINKYRILNSVLTFLSVQLLFGIQQLTKITSIFKIHNTNLYLNSNKKHSTLQFKLSCLGADTVMIKYYVKSQGVLTWLISYCDSPISVIK